MAYKASQSLVPLEKIESFITVEAPLLIVGLVLAAWLTNRFFLRQITDERKRILQVHFRNLSFHILIGSLFFALYLALLQVSKHTLAIERLTSYLGLISILSGATIFVKTCRILLSEYLFFSTKVAFPVLLVNLFTLLLSIFLGAWIGAEIFNIRLAPLLATSAIFSLVLGLALQDTLGNLFAGIALQLDKPYEIGDWVEVHNNGQKWVGQVYEITWRATILIAVTEESITVPNRVMSQAQILNFSSKYRPIIRSHVFRFSFGIDVILVKEILLKAINQISRIRKSPSPRVIIIETTESWISFKLVYYIDNYGDQFLIGDEVYSKCLDRLKEAGIELATGKLAVTKL